MFKTRNLIFCCCFFLIVSLSFSSTIKATDQDSDIWGDNLLDERTDQLNSLQQFNGIGSQKIQDLLEDTTNQVPLETPIGIAAAGLGASIIGLGCGTVGSSLGMKFLDSVGVTSERLPPGSVGAIFLTAYMALGPAFAGLSTTYKTVTSSQIWRPTYLYETFTSCQWELPKLTSLDACTLFGGLLYSALFTSVVVDIESGVGWLGISPHVWQGIFGSIIFISTICRYGSLMSCVNIISHETLPSPLYGEEDKKKQYFVGIVETTARSIRNGEYLKKLAQTVKVRDKDIGVTESEDESLSNYGSMGTNESEFAYIQAFTNMVSIQDRSPHVYWDTLSSEMAKWGSTSIGILETPMRVFSLEFFLNRFLQFCKFPAKASGWTSTIIAGIPGFLPIIGSTLQGRKVIDRELRQLLHCYKSEKWIYQKGDSFWEGCGNFFSQYIVPWAARIYTVPYSWQLTAGATNIVLADFILNGYSGCATAIAFPLFCFTQSFIAQYFEDEFTDILNWFATGAPNPCFGKILSFVDKSQRREDSINLLSCLKQMKEKLINFDKEETEALYTDLEGISDRKTVCT